MNTRCFKIIRSTVAIAVASAFSTSPARANYIVSLQEVGPNVVATGTGSIDLTGLSLGSPFGGSSGSGFAEIDPSGPTIVTGSSPSFVDFYQGPFILPAQFGKGGALANSGSGDLVGMGAQPSLFVPKGYVSDSPLSDASTYNNQTFASLGVIPGTYVWTWGNGPDQRFTLEIVQTPSNSVPDSGKTYLMLGCAVVGIVGLRKRFVA